MDQARLQAELCHEETKRRSWLDSDGQPLELRAWRTLWRTCSRKSQVLLGNGEYSEALALLQKSYGMAAECRWRTGCDGEA